jgi:hypothetical protein
MIEFFRPAKAEHVFSANGAAFTSKSATGRIRRGKPGAAPQAS